MRIPHLGLTLALCAAPALAQDFEVPAPAEQLRKLDRLVGTWEGEGTSKMMPGMPASKWTSTTTSQWILGGHFLRTDNKISVEGMPGQMHFVEFLGWDRENGRFMAYTTGNMGEVSSSEVIWTTPNTMVYSKTGFQMGNFFVERWVTKLGDGEMSYWGDQGQSHDDFFRYVDGKSTRTSETVSDTAIEDAGFMPMMQPSKHVKELRDMCGTYKLTATVEMPGTPKTEISSTDSVEMIFGGGIIQFHMQGDPHPAFADAPYEGYGYLGWSDHEDAYMTIWLNNMGEASVVKGWMMDDSLVMTWAQKHMGMPASMRHVIELDDDGKMTKSWGDAMYGADAPIRTFEGTYTAQ